MKLFLLSLFVTSAAMAGTVICQSEDGDLRVRVTPRGDEPTAVFVISDPSIQFGRKTIVSIQKAVVRELSPLRVSGTVDLRRSSVRRGELIGGTKLGQLKRILFTADGDEGTLVLIKRNGTRIGIKLACVSETEPVAN